MPDENSTTTEQTGDGTLATWRLALLGIYVAFWIIILTVALLKVLNALPADASTDKANQTNTNQANTNQANTNQANANQSNTNNSNSGAVNTINSNGGNANLAGTPTPSPSPSPTTSPTATPAPTPTPTPTPKVNIDIPLLGTWTVSQEVQRVLLVLFAGALGALIHAMRSFIYHTGRRDFHSSWVWFYLFHAFTGSTLALAVYMVIRGGFLQTAQQPDLINPYSFTALAIIVGAFSDNAWTKLKQVAETVFTQSDRERDVTNTPPKAPVIKTISPSQGVQSGGTEVTISGEGFTANSTVKFGNETATNVTFADGKLKVKVPAAAAPGPVDVVVSTGSQNSKPVKFTYT